MVAVRPLERDDLTAWRPLWDAYLVFYEVELDERVTAATFARLTGSGRHGLDMHGALAVDDRGAAIGFAHWWTHRTTWSTAESCYLEDLFVAESARGTGAGRTLIAHVRTWAERHGCADVHWLTADSNATAQRLYDRVARRTGMIQFEIPLEG